MKRKKDCFFIVNNKLFLIVYKVYISVFISCLYFSCIQEFIPQGIEEVHGILVVDGMIQNGESVFRLSYSVGIKDTLDGLEAINRAEVYVESNDGIRIPALFAGNGIYVAQTLVLDTTKAYRFSALIDGEICESEFLEPIITTGIDSVFPVKKDFTESVDICIATYDPENRSRYYRWTYHETWEVKAELYAHARYLEDENGRIIDWNNLIQHSLFTSENTYYCWGRDSSKTFFLTSTEKLSENRITLQKLVTIPCEHDKLSILYHIEVKQMQIRESAYMYFADVRELVERTGDIFDPILTNGIRGNIYYRDNPNRKIIGFIEVTTVTYMDRYIWEREGLYKPPQIMCKPVSYVNSGRSVTNWLWDKELIGSTFAYFNAEGTADKRCVDCRTKENASKVKPPGWPTDHL